MNDIIPVVGLILFVLLTVGLPMAFFFDRGHPNG